MKKRINILIMAFVAMVIITLSGYGQTDSTQTGHIDTINNQVETVVLPAIFDLLGAFGVKITPFAGILAGLIMWIIRRIEKNSLKAKHAADMDILKDQHISEKENIKTGVLNDLKEAAKNGNGSIEHISFIRNLIHKIENK